MYVCVCVCPRGFLWACVWRPAAGRGRRGSEGAALCSLLVSHTPLPRCRRPGFSRSCTPRSASVHTHPGGTASPPPTHTPLACAHVRGCLSFVRSRRAPELHIGRRRLLSPPPAPSNGPQSPVPVQAGHRGRGPDPHRHRLERPVSERRGRGARRERGPACDCALLLNLITSPSVLLPLHRTAASPRSAARSARSRAPSSKSVRRRERREEKRKGRTHVPNRLSGWKGLAWRGEGCVLLPRTRALGPVSKGESAHARVRSLSRPSRAGPCSLLLLFQPCPTAAVLSIHPFPPSPLLSPFS